MKDSIIDKASNLNASSHANSNDFISQRIDKLLQGQSNSQISDAVDLANNYLSILSTHHEEDLASPISHEEIISKKIDDIKLLEILLSLSHAEPATKSEKTTIKDMIAGLANLVIAKAPNASPDEHLEKLDALWDLKKDSHNEKIEQEIHQLEIALANALFAHKNQLVGGSPSTILELENKIAGLISLMIN